MDKVPPLTVCTGEWRKKIWEKSPSPSFLGLPACSESWCLCKASGSALWVVEFTRISLRLQPSSSPPILGLEALAHPLDPPLWFSMRCGVCTRHLALSVFPFLGWKL